MVRPDGQILFTPTPWTKDYPLPKVEPFPIPDGFIPGQFNTLAVARQGLAVSIYLNGRLVGTPITLEQPLGVSSCGLMGFQWGQGEVRAEFQRFTVWKLPSLER
jgi:hypothetical protein